MMTQAPQSCLVHGPSGCGKTTNAWAIAKVLGLRDVLDNWTPGKPAPLLNTLVLSSECDPVWHFKARAMTFDQAMQLVGRQEAGL
ncbi:AAA family ATPase [Pseudomonas monteilii]|uniref:AAA family ATPase n=1 Tax=Pseudomonas putida group TaxID=136845 RepID=UPI00125E7BDD|nr:MULTISPECIES: AAA family ATPase [Pseudomonas putida group]MBI6918196.1 AAA family ATPase [Pseudomonas monteilii]